MQTSRPFRFVAVINCGNIQYLEYQIVGDRYIKYCVQKRCKLDSFVSAVGVVTVNLLQRTATVGGFAETQTFCRHALEAFA